MNLVGEQVWRGALFLCDYIMYNKDVFNNKCVLELGAGTGLTSIIAAHYSKHVICTGTSLQYGSTFCLCADLAVKYEPGSHLASNFPLRSYLFQNPPEALKLAY